MRYLDGSEMMLAVMDRKVVDLVHQLVMAGQFDHPLMKELEQDVSRLYSMIALTSVKHVGNQKYRLGTRLASEFSESKAPKTVDLGDIILPYPSFMIQIPLETGIVDEKNRPFHSIIVTDHRKSTVFENDESGRGYIMLTLYSGDDPMTGMVNHLVVCDDENVENYLIPQMVKERAGDMLVAAVRLFVNTMMYLNSSCAELHLAEKPDEKRIRELEGRLAKERKGRSLYQKLEAKLEKERSKGYITYIAPKLEEKIEKQYQETAIGEKLPGAKRCRHRVRWFWNYYWCGKGEEKHLESRRIEGYERGGKPGDPIEREAYHLSDPQEE